MASGSSIASSETLERLDAGVLDGHELGAKLESELYALRRGGVPVACLHVGARNAGLSFEAANDRVADFTFIQRLTCD